MKTEPLPSTKPSAVPIHRRIEIAVGTTLAIAVTVLTVIGVGTDHGSGVWSQIGDFSGASPWTTLLAIFATILLAAIFIGAETALNVLRPFHVRQLKEINGRRGERIQKLLQDLPRFAAACSIGAHIARLALVLLTLLLTPGVSHWLINQFSMAQDFRTTILAAILLMVPVGIVYLVLGELVPKSYAVLHPHRVALLLNRPVAFATAVLYLPAVVATMIAGAIAARFGGKARFDAANAAEEEIKTLVESAEESGEIEVEEKKLLTSVFEFGDTVAREVMTPRVDMDAAPVNSEPEYLRQVISESGHSRIPLYEGTDDQIIGVIHAKDLLLALAQNESPNLRKLMRTPLFVPENKKVIELIAEMRLSRSQLAIVQDEFGGTAGVVTIEDIVEELVGDIVDEYDVEDPDVVKRGDAWSVNGKAHLDDVNEEIGSNFESDEFDTIGGFVFGLFGRQPVHGEVIEIDGFRISVEQTDGRRINRLEVSPVAVTAEPVAPTQSAEFS